MRLKSQTFIALFGRLFTLQEHWSWPNSVPHRSMEYFWYYLNSDYKVVQLPIEAIIAHLGDILVLYKVITTLRDWFFASERLWWMVFLLLPLISLISQSWLYLTTLVSGVWIEVVGINSILLLKYSNKTKPQRISSELAFDPAKSIKRYGFVFIYPA